MATSSSKGLNSLFTKIVDLGSIYHTLNLISQSLALENPLEIMFHTRWAGLANKVSEFHDSEKKICAHTFP